MVTSGSINKKAWPGAGIPASIPAANGAVGGPWSSVPLWRGLDEAFLCEPDIPKAPPTPRFQVNEVIAIPNSPDGLQPGSARANELGATQLAHRNLQATPVKMLLLSAALGFLGGIVVAWCTGLFG